MVLSNKSLDKVCMAAGLQDFVLPVVPSPTRPKPSNPRWSSTIVEAVIGGVYLDQGLDAAKTVARRLKIEVSEGFNDQVRTLLRLAYSHIKPCLDYLRLSSEGLVNQRRESQIEYRVMALGLASANAKCERGVVPTIGLLAPVIQLIEQSPPEGIKQGDPRFARASPNDPAQQAVASAPTWSKSSSVRRLRNTVTRTSPFDTMGNNYSL
ncbi:MAG: hypothetical protein Q9194_004803 [Teloschistes cf. exilis]